jgi:SH3-like domain-containing protein
VRSLARATIAITCAFLLLASVGCDRMRPKPKEEYVYVTVKQAYLRDRVAAVSNRIAIVTNGQQLTIVERQRRWVKVKTDKNQTGWIEERSVASASTAAEFDKLRQEHAKDPVVATGSVRDELYMHVKPGRDTDRFYLLPEGEKVQFLARAMAAKQATAQAIAAPTKVAEKPKPGKHTTKGPKPDLNAPAMPAPDPSLPPQEDWWLVRDSQGHVGWLLSRRLDVDVPDAIAGYAEGQKIVGAYLLSTIQDTEAQRADPNVPIYIVVLNAYKDGLPYDFDQIRVFTWSLKKHRYETAYREHGLQGYLPVTVVRQSTDQAAPTFGFKVATGDAVSVNAAIGAVKAGATIDRLYRLDGVIVRRVLPAGQSVVRASGTVKHPKRSADSPSGRHRRR